MGFQWLEMRIAEEQDRRNKQAQILGGLPRVVDELYHSLQECVRSYRQAFGEEAADIRMQGSQIDVDVQEFSDGTWQPASHIAISTAPSLLALQVDRGGEPLLIELGVLPGSKISYRHGDQYLSLEELTRRILDRAFFPKLSE